MVCTWNMWAKFFWHMVSHWRHKILKLNKFSPQDGTFDWTKAAIIENVCIRVSSNKSKILMYFQRTFRTKISVKLPHWIQATTWKLKLLWEKWEWWYPTSNNVRMQVHLRPVTCCVPSVWYCCFPLHSLLLLGVLFVSDTFSFVNKFTSILSLPTFPSVKLLTYGQGFSRLYILYGFPKSLFLLRESLLNCKDRRLLQTIRGRVSLKVKGIWDRTSADQQL